MPTPTICNAANESAGDVSLVTTAHSEGIVMCQTAISLATGASINGRLLAQTAITLDGSTVTSPAVATGTTL
ncbi:MAG TPA: ice-binding family protein [Verrucomicrobiae bacterium]|nr:ice-binding family protein [Verrucomicrobiae bacterium]